MDVAANIIFRSVGSIYEGTISSSALYHTLYFEESNKKTTYYGFRLREVIPTRLIVRIYEDGKNSVIDMIWMVDDSRMEGTGFVYFQPKSSKISVSGESKSFINKILSDATIDACYPDLLQKSNFFDGLMLGSRDKFSSKLRKELQLKIENVPTLLCAFSRCVLDTKELNNEDYQEEIVNAVLSLIDLVHRSFEILSLANQKKDESTIYCVRCGHELPSDSYYCPLCGSKQN
ncbi:MAG: hypothetical protein KGD64_02710 [Candidatus Heimdallarchaeota archaeon]|nr:hypothetical protein [Candidatus Heimdallarchaeota archaeon]